MSDQGMILTVLEWRIVIVLILGRDASGTGWEWRSADSLAEQIGQNSVQADLNRLEGRNVVEKTDDDIKDAQGQVLGPGYRLTTYGRWVAVPLSIPVFPLAASLRLLTELARLTLVGAAGLARLAWAFIRGLATGLSHLLAASRRALARLGRGAWRGFEGWAGRLVHRLRGAKIVVVQGLSAALRWLTSLRRVTDRIPQRTRPLHWRFPMVMESTAVYEAARRWSYLALAAVAAACSIFRMLGNPNIDRDALFFLAAAAIFITLERVSKFNIGKDGVSAEFEKKLEEVDEKVTEVKQIAEASQQVVATGVGSSAKSLRKARKAATEYHLPRVRYPDDPQKGRFGGKPEVNDREITAAVQASVNSPGNFDIHIEVRSTNPARPLQGEVVYFLHNTFPRPIRFVRVDAEGVAKLDLLAYGAFTVGAIADGGDTKLELDLSEDTSFPKEFRES